MPVPTVAIVVPGYSLGGGVPMVASLLAEGLSRRGAYAPVIVSVATSRADGDSVRLLSPRTWRRGPTVSQATGLLGGYQHVGAWFPEVETQRYRPRAVLTALLRRYDIVQIVAGTPAWAEVARTVDRPVCLQVATLIRVERDAKRRGTAPSGARTRLMTFANERIERRVWRNLDAVFVENQWMLEHVRRQYGSPSVYLAPPGIDTVRFSPAAYSQDGYVLSVGRFSDPRKNIRLLFQAYAMARSGDVSFPPLVLAGTSPNEADLRFADSLGLRAHLTIYENVSEAHLVNLYRGARVFALASNEEGLGLVILEAMSTGVPVVATECGGPSTMITPGRTGTLTPVGDARALAEALKEVVRDPELAHLYSTGGRARALGEFSMDVASARFEAVYDQMLRSR